MKHVPFAHFVAVAPDAASMPCEPSPPMLLPPHAVPPRPVLKTFADVDDFIRRHLEWREPVRGPLRSTCRGVACRVNAILAGQRNEPFEPDPKKLDLATVPFDIAMINAAWKGRSYRAAGFDCAKSFRNARWAIRRVGRATGTVVPRYAPSILPGDPFEPLQQTLNKYDRPAIGHFVTWCRQTGRGPADVNDAALIAYRTHVTTHMVGKRADQLIRLIAQLWNGTAQREPGWPQARLSAPSLLERYTLPFTAYAPAFQDAVAALEAWMTGTKRRHAPGRRQGRKLAMRPTTVKSRLYYIRSAAWALVAKGRDPASLTLGCLLEGAEGILEYYEERGRARQQALPEADRVSNPLGTTAQTQSIGKTLVMIAQYCEVPAETLKALKALAADFRVPPLSKPTLKNRRRVSQFLDDRAKLQRLMRLPRTLMDEALALREASANLARQAARANGEEAALLAGKAAALARQAAHRGREAALVGILCRIPLRIKNLQEIRIGANLLFTGGSSEIVTLRFTEAETKSHIDLQFYIGPRLHALLRTYIDHFLPYFAARAADVDDNRWLFPSGRRHRAGPASIEWLRAIIVRTVAENVGATINPHLFRALAVTLALEHSPGALEHCRLLLGDKTLGVVLRHYAMTCEADAARRQSALVDAEEDRLTQGLAPPLAPRKGRRR